MAEKIHNDALPNEEKKTLPWWKESLFWLELRAVGGLLFGMLFFVLMTLFVFNMGTYINDAMETISRIELMVLFVVLMHIMADWFWFTGLNKWIVNDSKWLWVFAFLAFAVYAAACLIILVVFLSEALDFYWEDREDMWRLLPVGCVLVSVVFLLRKLFKPGSVREK